MNHLSKSVLVVMGMLAGAQSSFASSTMDKELSQNIQGVDTVRIDAGAGDLVVKGEKDITEVYVEASIYGDDVEDRDYKLELTQQGNEIELISHIKSRYNEDGYIDLKVMVPEHLVLKVKDSSGDLKVTDMKAGVTIKDSSGSLKVRSIAGGLDIEDSSGDISVITVAGDVNIEDSSGELELITVAGNVTIEDGSGDIEVKTVTGDLDVEDATGDVEVYTVSGKVTMEDGSGDIYVNGANDFYLRRDGSGDVKLVNVSEH